MTRDDEELELVEDDENDEEDDLEEAEVDELDGYGGMAVVRGFTAGLVLGAIVGAGLALLVAPDRGDVVRQRIKRSLRGVQDDARDRLDDWRGEARRELKKQRRRLQRRLRRRSRD